MSGYMPYDMVRRCDKRCYFSLRRETCCLQTMPWWHERSVAGSATKLKLHSLWCAARQPFSPPGELSCSAAVHGSSNPLLQLECCASCGASGRDLQPAQIRSRIRCYAVSRGRSTDSNQILVGICLHKQRKLSITTSDSQVF